MDTINQQYIDQQQVWSAQVFGPGRRTLGIVSHIRKELEEILAEPQSIEEWCDVIILALDGAWRAGHHPTAIIQQLWRKQNINFQREWPPVGQPEDVAVEHKR